MHVQDKQQPGDELARDKNVVWFTRKLAKTGANYVIWIPRDYIRKGLVDPNAEYEIYLRKIEKERR